MFGQEFRKTDAKLPKRMRKDRSKNLRGEFNEIENRKKIEKNQLSTEVFQKRKSQSL